MTRDEETYFLRLMQVADQATLDEHFHLVKTTENPDGSTDLQFDASYGHDEGYLTIKYDTESGALIAAEMNVGFQTMIGLNRSPLELRILAEHILNLRNDA